MMAKGYNLFIKSDSSSLSNGDEQKIVHENGKTSTHDNFLQSSQNFLKKIYKITFHSMSLSQKEQNSSDTCNNISEEKGKNSLDTSKTTSTPSVTDRSLLEPQVDLKSTSNEKPELKGILKNATKNLSYSNSMKGSRNNHNNIQPSKPNVETCHTTNSKEKNDGLMSSNSDGNNLCSTSNPSKPIKHVTFNDKISRKRYKPRKLFSDEIKLPSRQQQKLNKLQRRDSLSLHSIKSIDANCRTSLKVQEFDIGDSSEYESSGDED